MRGLILLSVHFFLIIAVFLSVIVNLYAASLHTENSTPIDLPALYFNVDSGPIYSKPTVNTPPKQPRLLYLLNQKSLDTSKNNNPRRPPSISSNPATDNVIKPYLLSSSIKKEYPSESSDIVKISYGKLNEIMNDEILEDTVLIARELNIKLNEVNQKIDQKVAPAIEDIFIIQRFFSSSPEEKNFLVSDKSRLNTKHKINIPPSAVSDTEYLDDEQIDGFFGFLLRAPKYLFNIKSLIIFLIALFLLSGIMKTIHFILNKIY